MVVAVIARIHLSCVVIGTRQIMQAVTEHRDAGKKAQHQIANRSAAADHTRTGHFEIAEKLLDLFNPESRNAHPISQGRDRPFVRRDTKRMAT